MDSDKEENNGIDDMNDSETALSDKNGAEQKSVADAAVDSDASTVLDDKDVLEQASTSSAFFLAPRLH
jgi:hypothetical protein